MSEETKPLNLMQKIREVSGSIAKIKMTGVNTHDNYKYLKIEDVVDAVRPHMNRLGLVLTPQIKKIENVPDTKGILRDMLVEWTLEDVESGEKRVWEIPGTGWDYHDKGTYKAMTGSRKYALILIFNLPVGDNPEQTGASFEEGKWKQAKVAASKIADAAGKGNKTALDTYSQIEPEKKITITRPEEFNGHFIIVSGFIAAPPLDQFFEDTGSKRINSKQTGKAGWKVPSDYEKGLVDLCARLKVDVEG